MAFTKYTPSQNRNYIKTHFTLQYKCTRFPYPNNLGGNGNFNINVHFSLQG